MKWKRQKVIVGRALYKSYSQLKQDSIAAKMQRGYWNSSRLCGYSFDPNRKWLRHKCHKATCCQCNSRWSKRLAKLFLLCSDDVDKSQYRMITLMFDLQPSVNDCLNMFDVKRGKIRRSIYKARKAKKDILLAEKWKRLTMAGSLEIDLFYKEDFSKLGLDKQSSYQIDFGFQPDLWSGLNIFVPHYHGIIHLGGLDEHTLRKRLLRLCKVIHIQPLRAD